MSTGTNLVIEISAEPERTSEGGIVELTAIPPDYPDQWTFAWSLFNHGRLDDPPDDQNGATVHWNTSNLKSSVYRIQVTGTRPDPPDGVERPDGSTPLAARW